MTTPANLTPEGSDNTTPIIIEMLEKYENHGRGFLTETSTEPGRENSENLKVN